MSFDVPSRANRFRFESLEPRRLLAVQLVADLNPATLGSEPENFTSDGSTAWFVAKSADNTLGLWRSDGTPTGTALVRGKLAVTTYPHALAVVGPRLYFANVDPEHGAELWTSDGTAAGTVFVEDLNPGTEFNAPINSEPSGFTAVGDPAAGRAIFAARGPDGRELFVTDGAPEGTYQVADLLPGPNNSWPFAFRRVGDNVLFFADDPSGAGLWKTDGTAEGTTRLATLGPANSLSGFPFVAEGVMYFTAWSPGDPTRRVIWRSDGTAAGTRPLLTPDAPPYYGIFDAASFANGAGAVWFAGLDGPGGSADLWRTDGTAAGTVKAIDLPQSIQQIGDLTYLGGGRLVWGAMDTASAQYQVWYSDGTQVGTRILKSFPQTNNSVAALSDFGFRSFGDRVLFVAYTPEQGRDFWLTDGTPAGTVPLDIDPGPAWGTSTNGFTEPRAAWAGSRLVFQGAGEPGDTEPWVSDGTAAGTHELVEVNAAPASSDIIRPMVRLRDGVIFDTNGTLWFTDGTPGSVVRLADMNLLNFNGTAVAAVPPSSALLPNGVAVFGVASPDRTVRRVYRSDGTVAGTFALGNLDPSPGTLPSNTYWSAAAGAPFVTAGNFVYFVATDGTHGMELWKTDGTVTGTTIVDDAAPGSASAISGGSSVPALATVGDKVFFKVRDDELWKTDGTEAGTVLVKDFGINDSGRTAFHTFVPFGNKLLFSGPESNLFASDGTPAGTIELLDRVQVVSDIVPAGGNVYFWGRDVFTDAVRLYRSDGTPAGSGRVGTFEGTPTETSVRLRPLVAFNGMLYFSAKTTATGSELWRTDGTDAGTTLLADIRSGAADARPTHLAVFDGRLYFFATDGTHGHELRSTDGTPGGTRLEQDIYPGTTGSSAPGPLFPTPVATEDELFFVAADDVTGRELRRVTGTPAPGVAARHLFYNDSAFDGFDAAANFADDGAIATDKAAMAPGQVATFANVSGYARGINGIMVDLFAVTADLDADDFEFAVSDGSAGSTWAAAPAPVSVTERIPPALAAPTRVTLIWPEGAIRNRWLRVTVKANGDTHLAVPDVFYFGSLIGETGDNSGGAWAVDAADVLRTRAAATPAAGITNPFDHNRDGRVNALDVAIARRNVGHVLTRLAVPIPAPPIAYAPLTPRRAPRPRSAWVEATG